MTDTQAKSNRQSNNRIDTRFPDEIYEAIKSIAHKDGAKIHHRSGEIMLAPTVVKLIRIGISQLSDDYRINLSDINLSDTTLSDNLTSRVVSIEQELSELKKLVISLSDSSSDKKADEKSDVLSDKSSSISNEQAQPYQVSATENKQKLEEEPDWVNNHNRRFYLKLINDPDLLVRVAELIELHPTENKALAESLISTGLHKENGTALDSASITRIKKVMLNLNTL